jgi:hypothetical protein
MMREIKFRGRYVFEKNALYPAVDEWVYGYLSYDDDGQPWIKSGISTKRVVAGTEGQFIGLEDKYGVEMYERDVVECSLSFEGEAIPHMGEIVYDETFGAFGTRNDAGVTLLHNHCLHTLKVLGNMCENPEILERR